MKSWMRGFGQQIMSTNLTSNTLRLADESDGLHRARVLLGLAYLFFVYLPMLFWPDRPASAIWASLIATAVFVPLYFYYHLSRAAHRIPLALLMAVLGYALVPFNPGGNTFVIYAIAMLAATLPARWVLVSALLLLALLGIEYALTLPNTTLVAANLSITVLISGVIASATLMAREREHRNAELRLTQTEVKRLATMAERERIARDLHDLLGHTLSLVALKSELAGRLIDVDSAAAKVQIADVQQVARSALAQVREAVSGFRNGSIEAELASARLTLLSAGVHFDQRCTLPQLPPQVESALSLSLREAITNVIRHANANAVEVDCETSTDGGVQMTVSDDGRGGVSGFGNGLSGLRERMAALGGSLSIDSPAGGGTRIRFALPATAGARQ